MSFPWWIFPLTAAVLWGLMYALFDVIYKHVSIPASLFYGSLISCCVYGVVTLLSGHSLRLSNTQNPLAVSILLLFILSTVIMIAANFLISYAIRDSGAAFVTIIEISYPFFVLLFSFLLFKNQVAHWGWFLFGASLLFAGVSVIILKAK